VARAGAIASGWALMLISLATCVEVIGRKYFSFSFKGIDEIGGYVLAGTSAIGFSYALMTRAHMRITLLFPYIPSSARAFLNVVALVTLAGLAIFCAVRGYAEVDASLTSMRHANTPLQTPMWIPQSIWWAGLVLFAVATTLQAIHAFGLLWRDQGTLNRLYGPQTLEEEIATEVALAEQRETRPDEGAVRT